QDCRRQGLLAASHAEREAGAALRDEYQISLFKLMENWEPERKTARRKCSKALALILDIIRKNAAHASLKAVDASRECPA
ncbi:MAG: hypothetical protein WA231_09950, partial [Methylocella sp.]